MDTGKAIKTIMGKRRITAVELANELDVTRQTVHNWTSGNAQPSVKQLQGVADYCKVTFTYLASLGKENEAPQ